MLNEIDYWFCRHCGYRMSPLAYELLKANVECRCRRSKAEDWGISFKPRPIEAKDKNGD